MTKPIPDNKRKILKKGATFEEFKSFFWAKVDKLKGCWIWKGYQADDGYGRLPYKRKTWPAHRMAFFIQYGDFNRSLFVCHKCDNPICVRPDHLFLGTAKDNTQDACKKGRMKPPKYDPDCLRKLSDVQIINIKSSKQTRVSLAKKYKVNRSTIQNIVLGKSWKNL